MQPSTTHPTSLESILTHQIQAQGAIPFSAFMQTALYHPELGYYCREKQPFGVKGDFTTAPELSPLFSHCLAKQIIEVGAHLNQTPSVLELGAGTGKMASDILRYLGDHNSLPECYYILEISPSLFQQQQTRLQADHPELSDRIKWVQDFDQLPDNFEGVMLGNEWLDALPVELFQIGSDQEILRGYVTLNEDNFRLTFAPTNEADFLNAVRQELAQLNHALPMGYTSEINLAMIPWMAKLASKLHRGIMLWIDYGFGRKTFYHPDRKQGTLMCHHQHRSHGDAFREIGAQDITAHVNFSHVNDLAKAASLETLGFTTQANFLLSLNILESLTDAPFNSASVQQTHALQILLQPHEMGELFKMIALGKDYPYSLQGFSQRNYLHQL